jgi:uncharacterized RDD family membrane protein YckC
MSDATALDSAAARTAAVDGIVTPEALVLEVDTAGVASRVMAGILDMLMQLALLFAGFLLLVLVSIGSFDSDGDSTYVTASIILVTAVLLGYPIVFETLMRGSTPGKRMVGLRAVTVEGAPIRLRHAALRAMGGLIDRYLVPTGIIGVLFVFGTRRHQRVGDLLAGTIVIRDPDRARLPAAIWFPVPPGLESFAAGLDPTALTVEQYTVIRSFLMRNLELSEDARYSVALDLAAKVAATTRFGDHTRVHPEAFLLCAIARYQRRTFPHYQPAAWSGR